MSRQNCGRGVGMSDTPRVIVNKLKMNSNILLMQCAADNKNIMLRPHIKAHKCPDIMKKQLAAGACGITVAKIGEAEIMVQAGCDNIFIANQIVSLEKMAKLIQLRKKARLILAVDNLENAQLLGEVVGAETPLEVRIEIDTGLKRCGISPEQVVPFATELIKIPGLLFEGLFTHAGHAYGASPAKMAEVGRNEAQIMVECAGALRNRGIRCNSVSTGSTPTAMYNLDVPGVTEIRPGNYVFYDAMQVALGTVPFSRCALSVIATVISNPVPGRVIIDAGSKVFALDKGAHGLSTMDGYGYIVGWPNMVLARLSEEHGIIEASDKKTPQIGAEVEIIPNHACVVVNLTDVLWVDGEAWPVEARGLVT
ncbi:MAG: alanine racemase [bacterium]|nr:alanine racemase [bacterium]